MTGLAQRPAAELRAPVWHDDPPTGRADRAGLDVGLALVIASLVPLALVQDVWAAQALAIVVLCTAPGLALLAAVRVPMRAVRAFPLYVPVASLAVVTVSALLLDLCGPEFGLADPLRMRPLLATLLGTCAVLIVWGALRRAPDPVRLTLPASVSPVAVAAMALPLAAAAGAALLDNGSGAGVAIAACAGVAVALVGTGLAARRLSPAAIGAVLFACGLAMLWAFSLRGDSVYGFDITRELHVVASTSRFGVWQTAHPDDAYGAMLSLSVLPSSLGEISGLSPLTLVTVVYPALFALLPVGIFHLARRFVSPRWAFVAAAFVIVQAPFFQQLPALARQEIALLFFICLVAVVLERRMGPWSAGALAAVFALGVVVSHYSTAYMAVAMFAITAVLQAAAGRRLRIARAAPTLLVGLLFLTAGAGLWNYVVTDSASNTGGFAADFREKGFDLLPNARPGQSLLSSYLNGNQTQPVSPEEFERLVREDYRADRPYVTPLRAAKEPRYELGRASVPNTKADRPGFNEPMRTAQTAIAQLANVLAVLGALALVFVRGRGKRARLLGLLGLATLGGLVFLRLSGTAAAAYNQERALIQMLVPLSIALAWVLMRLSARLPRRLAPALPVVAVLALGVVFFNTSGLRGAAAGGARPANLSAEGEDAERFVVSGPELAAAGWAGRAVPPDELLYADRYGQLRIIGATGRSRGLLVGTTPATLDRDAWVYGSATNTVLGRARGDVDGRSSVYRWPRRFLVEQYDRVYANGTSEVYHR